MFIFNAMKLVKWTNHFQEEIFSLVFLVAYFDWGGESKNDFAKSL